MDPKPLPHDQTGQLVHEASNGDPRACDDLLAQHLPMLRGFIRLRVGPRILGEESAADVVQSVCREVLQDLSGYDYRGVQSFRKWLCMTALRKIRDRAKFYGRQRRDIARNEPLPDESAAAFAHLLTPSRVAAGHEEMDRVTAALRRLSEDDQTVITMSKMLGMGHDEIAAELGKTPNATRVMLHRALAKLGRFVEEG